MVILMLAGVSDGTADGGGKDYIDVHGKREARTESEEQFQETICVLSPWITLFPVV